MPAQFGAIGLRYIVGIKIHGPIFQATEEVDHAALIVYPELLPTLQVLVKGVVAFAEITACQARPILPDHAAANGLLDVAVSHLRPTRSSAHIPIADPEIELPVISVIFAGLLIMFGLFHNFGKLRIRTQALQIGVGG